MGNTVLEPSILMTGASLGLIRPSEPPPHPASQVATNNNAKGLVAIAGLFTKASIGSVASGGAKFATDARSCLARHAAGSAIANGHGTQSPISTAYSLAHEPRTRRDDSAGIGGYIARTTQHGHNNTTKNGAELDPHASYRLDHGRQLRTAAHRSRARSNELSRGAIARANDTRGKDRTAGAAGRWAQQGAQLAAGCRGARTCACGSGGFVSARSRCRAARKVAKGRGRGITAEDSAVVRDGCRAWLSHHLPGADCHGKHMEAGKPRGSSPCRRSGSDLGGPALDIRAHDRHRARSSLGPHRGGCWGRSLLGCSAGGRAGARLPG